MRKRYGIVVGATVLTCLLGAYGIWVALNRAGERRFVFRDPDRDLGQIEIGVAHDVPFEIVNHSDGNLTFLGAAET